MIKSHNAHHNSGEMKTDGKLVIVIKRKLKMNRDIDDLHIIRFVT